MRKQMWPRSSPGFFTNCIDTFAVRGCSVYLTGESYTVYCILYIAHAMFEANETTYFSLSSIMISDPSLTYTSIQQRIAAVPFVDYWCSLLNLNSTFLPNTRARAVSYGSTS